MSQLANVRWILIVSCLPIAVYGLGILVFELTSSCGKEFSLATALFDSVLATSKDTVPKALFFAERKTAYYSVAVFIMTFAIFFSGIVIAVFIIFKESNFRLGYIISGIALLVSIIGISSIFSLYNFAHNSCIISLYYNLPHYILSQYYNILGRNWNGSATDLFQTVVVFSVVLTNFSWVFCCGALFASILKLKSKRKIDEVGDSDLSNLKLGVFNAVLVLIASSVSLNTLISWPAVLLEPASSAAYTNLTSGLSFYYAAIMSLVMASVYLPVVNADAVVIVGLRKGFWKGGEENSSGDGILSMTKHAVAIFSPLLATIFQQSLQARILSL